MTIILDASVLVAAVIDSSKEGIWAGTLTARDDIVAPEVALAEASNVLRRLELSGEIPPGEATEAQRDLLRLGLHTVNYAPYAQRIWSLRHNLTCYDARYVAVAEALNCPLATLDRRLSHASGPTCEFIVPALGDHAGN